MTKKEFSKKVGSLRSESQSRINNLHIWSSIAIDTLERTLKTHALQGGTFPVPSSTAIRKIERSQEQVDAILQGALDRDLYASVLVNLVAQVEAFLNDVVFELLCFDNRRLKQGVPGMDRLKSIDVEDILDSASKEELIETIINKNLLSLFYAGPKTQFDYFKKVVGVDITEPRKGFWAELKATRDLIVHNSGKINEVYLNKCGAEARGDVGEIIEIDKVYFEKAIAGCKGLIGTISSQLQKKYGPKTTQTSQK